MKRAAFLLRMRDVLLKRRDALRRSLNDELALLSRNINVVDECDEALEAETDEMFSRLSRCEDREAAAIQNALSRLRRGHYGVCELCGANISVARLRALPYATSCIKCQREMEQRRHHGDECPLDWGLIGDDHPEQDGPPWEVAKFTLERSA